MASRSYRAVILRVTFLCVVQFILGSAVLDPIDMDAWNSFFSRLEPNGNSWYFKHCKCRTTPDFENCNINGDLSPCGCTANNGAQQVVCETIGDTERITQIVLPQNRLFGDFPKEAVQAMTALNLLNVSSLPTASRENNVFLDQPPEGCFLLNECFTGQLTCDFRNSFESGISLCTPTTVSPTPSPTPLPTATPITRNPTTSPNTSPTTEPTAAPSLTPSTQPTAVPSISPTTVNPTSAPTTQAPTTPPPTSSPTTTAPTLSPVTASPSATPTSAPPSPQPSNAPSSPSIQGNLNALEQRAWESFYDDLNGQDWAPCAVSRQSPCNTVCTGSNGVTCVLDGSNGRRLQDGDNVMTLTAIELSQNNVKGKLESTALDGFPSLQLLDFTSAPLESNANFIVGSGEDNCIQLPQCYEPDLRCDFVDVGTTVCDLVPTVSPTPLGTDTEPLSGPNLIALIVIVSLLAILLFLICCCCCLRVYAPNWLPLCLNDLCDAIFGNWYYSKDDSESSSTVSSVAHPDIQVRVNTEPQAADFTPREAVNASPVTEPVTSPISANPDLQRAKQEALDVDRVVTKDIKTVDDLLHQAKMPQYAQVFFNEGLDLNAAVLATNEQLRTLGIPMGDRVKFLRVTKLIRELPQ